MKRRTVKRVSVSSERQISIPKDFYDAIDIGEEVLVELINNRIVIKPVYGGSEAFSEEILADLIQEGCSIKILMEEFKARKEKAKLAVHDLIAEAREQNYTTVDELFSEPEENRKTE